MHNLKIIFQEFTQAMTDFKVMFPDLEADVIEAVLRANNGAVDITIDHLLTMTADYEAAKSGTGTEQQSSTTTGSGDDKPPAYTGHPPPSYQQATKESKDEAGGGGAFTDDLINLGQDESHKQQQQQQSLEEDQQHSIPHQTAGSGGDLLSDFDSLGASGGATTTSSASKENPDSTGSSEAVKYSGSSPKHAYSHPKRQEADDQEFQSSQSSSSQQNILPTQQQLHEIYEENLRLREEVGKSTGSASDAAARNQYLEDERIALMLQNEEFMAELRRDTDFMTALEQEHERANLAATESSKLHMGSGAEGGGAASGGKAKGMLDDEFRDKLKNMGKTSKKKFSQLAAIFSRRKSAAKQLLGGHAGAPSKDNLLLNAEPLVNEDDSDTEEDTNNTNGKKQKTPTKGKYTSFS